MTLSKIGLWLANSNCSLTKALGQAVLPLSGALTYGGTRRADSPGEPNWRPATTTVHDNGTARCQPLSKFTPEACQGRIICRPNSDYGRPYERDCHDWDRILSTKPLHGFGRWNSTFTIRDTHTLLHFNQLGTFASIRSAGAKQPWKREIPLSSQRTGFLRPLLVVILGCYSLSVSKYL